MSFIDASYFVGNLNIPNSAHPATLETITWFIQKYEPVFLEKALGYPLYKAFAAGMNVVPPVTPAIRYLDILFGKEYIDLNGRETKWNGLIITDNPIFNLSGGYVYKKPIYLQAGSTVGLTPATNTAVFDGTGGKDDWRGWTPILSRTAIMKPGIDYSWDPDSGTLHLLAGGDLFGAGEFFFAQFELRTNATVAVVDLAVNQSAIANFVYYWFSRNNTTQSTGIGEVRTDGENAVTVSPRQKMISCWNEMSRTIKDLMCFLEASTVTYPEWTLQYEYETRKYFKFINPIF